MKFQGKINLNLTLAALVGVVMLAGCSAGGTSPTKTTGPVTPTAADLVVSVSKSQISSSGSDTATVTVTAVDSSRNAVASIPVTITPDNNAVFSGAATATNASGIVTGTLGVGSDHSNRTIDVVVTSGSMTRRSAFRITRRSWGTTNSASFGGLATAGV